MQSDLIPKDPQTLIVRAEPIELVLSEEGGASLALVLPPLEDLAEIGKLAGRHFSLKEKADHEWEPFKAAFADELAHLGKKKGRFGNSKTFVTHLANLAELAGVRDAEYQILVGTSLDVQDTFLKFRLGENLQAQGRFSEAESLFSSFDLTTDTAANLRIAYFHAQRKQFDEAATIVARVLSIDPLDYGGRLFEGALRLSKGLIHEAIQSFRIAEAGRPTSSILFTNLGIAYICAKKHDKALAALRKAVALDPLNHNALALLADAAYAWGRDEDAVPALRYYVNLEQRLPSIWGRLARALLKLGHGPEALEALRRQGSQEDTSAVWNNIGVAHVACGNGRRALSAFKHAVAKMTPASMADGFLAVRNILATLVEEKSFEDALRIARMAIADDHDYIIPQDKKLSDIYAFMIHSLRYTNHASEAVRISEDLLQDERIVFDLRIWIVTQLLAYYSIAPGMSVKALALASQYGALLGSLGNISDTLHEVFINNLTFAFAETDCLEEVKRLLPYLGNLVHKSAYPTATLGLIHMRKGHIEKGTELYEEAVSLASSAEDKRRIRQKFNLEMGLYLLGSDTKRAVRLLKKVESESAGAQELSQKAHSVLLTLGQAA